MRELVAWTGLYLAASFLFSNIAEVSRGSGYLFVLGVIGCAAATIALTHGAVDRLVLRASTLFLSAFVAYFLFRLAVDFGTVDAARAVTIGTSGGVLFAFGFGLAISVLVFGVSSAGCRRFTELAVFGFYMLSLALAYGALKSHLSSLADDLFVATNIAGAYQRPGDLLVIAALISSAVLLLVDMSRPLRSATVLGLYLGLIGLLLVIAQLIGSNAAFVVTLGLGVTAVLWRAVLHSRSLAKATTPMNGRMTLRRLASRLAPQFALHAVWVAVSGALIFMGFLRWTGLEIRHLRIFGYAQGTLGGESFASRMRILQNEFIDQMSVAPAFGYLRAEEVVTGVGMYAHSLVSVASHLGLLGATLFTGYFIAANRELLRVAGPPATSWDMAQAKVLRLLLLYIIVGFALVGTFFTWMPLWFALGLLLTPMGMEKA